MRARRGACARGASPYDEVAAACGDDEDAPPVTGNVTFQCGRDVVEARFRSAAFGPLLAPHAPLGVGFAVPPSLCALSGVERRLAGLAAVAQRGTRLHRRRGWVSRTPQRAVVAWSPLSRHAHALARGAPARRGRARGEGKGAAGGTR